MDGRDPEKMQLRAALEASESALRELREFAAVRDSLQEDNVMLRKELLESREKVELLEKRLSSYALTPSPVLQRVAKLEQALERERALHKVEKDRADALESIVRDLRAK